MSRAKERVEAIAENIDRLITTDVASRGTIGILYPHARSKVGEPLVLYAARKLLDSAKPGGVVFIATGWPDRPWVSPHIAELDGPIGAAVLSRALHIAFNAVPIILTERDLVSALEVVVRAAGLVPVTPEQGMRSIESPKPIHTASVLHFPMDTDLARETSRSLIEKFSPWAVIAIEKGGMNEKGRIHTGEGYDTTDHTAKIDFLVRDAKEFGILTIGIGDGGNEIGMGLIREEIKQRLPYGSKCQCACGSGIASVTETDVLVTSAVSNWGAYGIEACLAVLLQKPEIMHDRESEVRMLESASISGLIDGSTGFSVPSVDGLPVEVHASLVYVLRALVTNAIKHSFERGEG